VLPHSNEESSGGGEGRRWCWVSSFTYGFRDNSKIAVDNIIENRVKKMHARFLGETGEIGTNRDR